MLCCCTDNRVGYETNTVSGQKPRGMSETVNPGGNKSGCISIDLLKKRRFIQS